MATKRDYYEVLNIPKSASLEEIKKAYREAALRYHPDRVSEKEKKEAEEKFKEISEAYAILSDPQKRALYDQRGHSGIDQRYAQEDIFKGTDFSSVFSDLSDFGFGEGLFDKIFGDAGFDIFGNRRRRARSQQGRDLQITTEISLEEAASGIEKSIVFHRYDPCGACHGSGVEPGTGKTQCPQCQGSGRVVASSGSIKMIRPCPSCNGEGSIFKTSCSVCHGAGRIQTTRRLTITIPPGVDTGSELRIAGEGEIGPQGRGDLYLLIEVKSHPYFKRVGYDLRTEMTIPLTLAMLGGEIEVPTLKGKVAMTIPEGTQSGSLFRLKNKGLPKLTGQGYGDQLIQVTVEIPKVLTAQQRKLMEEFARTVSNS
jgi:molecular chaperone DnaJ